MTPQMNLTGRKSDISNMTGLLPSGAVMSSEVLTADAAAPRSAVIAGLLSAIAPGVGQVYTGRPWRGAALFAALLAVQGAILGSAFLMPASFGAIAAFAVIGMTATLGTYILVIFDAVRLARSGGRAAYRWYVLVAAAAAVYLVCEAVLMVVPIVRAALPWHTFNVSSASMEPTLRLGEIFIADSVYFDTNAPRRADVVVYRLPKDPETVFVKRVVALTGDRIAFRGGHAFINGAPVLEPYARFGDPNSPFNTMPEYLVPPNAVFVAGDARDNSLDSRDLNAHGPVPFDNLIGRATEIVVSPVPDRAGLCVGSPR
jgi:signal peptidase I